ncbi:MAG: Cmm like protein, partial [Planctomycetota bacterium]
VLGLLGGVASGKSTVAGLFAQRGLVHVDADQVARTVSEDPGILGAIRAALGPGALGPDGRLDRPAVARLVFSDPVLRQRLEEITHPPVRRRILAELAAARARGESVLLDVPLLLEGGLIDQCDAAVFVAADRAERLRRAALRGWGPDELDRRERAQAPLAEKQARARFTVDNGGSLAATAAQVDAVLAQLAPGTG